VRRDLPTLAICRGSQLLNVAFGGTLIPDISDWEMHHGGSGEPLFIDEPVILEPDSEIARILGRTEVTVRNGHHQAVAEVAPALRATARAHDGIVEGTEHRDASWVVGVQWHPEEPQADAQDRASLFGEFVTRSRTTP
jgi:putative glutamine amidotransferase